MCRGIQGDCGRYSVPGSGVEHDYAGVVEASFVIRLGEHVSFTLTGMRVIDHPFALFLLGADILCGGRMTPLWNYTCVSIVTSPCGKVSGSVSFDNGVQTEKIALAKAA